MDDSLTISGGGSTAVATDELFVDAARLGSVEAVAGDWIERSGVIWRGLLSLDLDEPTLTGITPGWDLQTATRCLDAARGEASELRSALIESAERYGATERLVDAFWRIGGAQAAWVLGAATPLLAGIGLVTGGAQWVASSFGWQTPLATWLAEQRGVLSDPMFVRAVRTAADSADEYVGGFLHSRLLAAVGNLIGAPENASMLLGAAGVLGALFGGRVLVDGPVSVSREAHAAAPAGHPAAAPLRPATPPTGVGDLAERVPSPSAGDAQIRIEQYGEAGDNRWIVYIGGTVEFGLTAGEEPFDMPSNLHGIADRAGLDALRIAGAESGAGERAVRQAMAEAGVKPGDPLLAVGYSAGGIIAANLAADPELNTVGVVNLGGPVASADTRESVPVLSIEHEEDLVPAVGGAGHPSPERLTLSRSVLEEGRHYEALLPAHELARYRASAALVDESEEERLAEFRTFVGEFTGGTQGAASEWIARRDLSSSRTGAR